MLLVAVSKTSCVFGTRTNIGLIYGIQKDIVDEFCVFAGGPDEDTSSESDSSELVESDTDSD